MLKSGKVSELRADGSDLGPPASLSGARPALPPRLKTAGTVDGIKASQTARVSPGAANSPIQVTDPQPRCFGPPAYPQDFIEWLKTSESPARKALRGLIT